MSSKEEVAVDAAEAGGAAGKVPYWDPPPAPLLDTSELGKWSLYRALIAEFMATLIFLYVSIATVIGYKNQSAVDKCTGVGYLGVAWSFGATIFILVYCTGGVSGGHINPAVTFGLFVGRKLSLIRALLYIVAQCLGAICGVGIVKGIMKHPYDALGGGANSVSDGYSVGGALGAEIVGTFILVYTVFSATDPKRTARDSFIPVRACRALFLHAWSHGHVEILTYTPRARICVGVGASADRVRGVRGAPGDDTHHRHGHQPGEEPGRRRLLQPTKNLERPLDLLGWAAGRGDGGGDLPQVGAARGGRQGAQLLQEHQRDGVTTTTTTIRAATYCKLVVLGFN
ncbi:hypothetical protein ABZP36_036152 [Zizania latifolia]